MNREYDVTACSNECGALMWRKFKDGPRMAWQTVTFGLGHKYDITMMRGFYEKVYCPLCGSCVGIDAEGRPWRERMVPESALEWLAEQWSREKFDTGGDRWEGPRCPLSPGVDLYRTICPYAPEAFDQPCQVLAGKMTFAECCVEAALKVAEEDGDDE